MSGIRHELNVDDKQLRFAATKLLQSGGNLRPAFKSIGEAMLRSTDERFRNQVDPQGQPWKPLAASTLKRKRGPKILTESHQLRNSMTYKADDEKLQVGTNAVHAAIHQLGGTIRQRSRRQVLAFNKKGRFLGHKAASKRKTSVNVRIATIGPRLVRIPARPFLGVSAKDKDKVIAILKRHLER